jgi:hypothetical protein
MWRYVMFLYWQSVLRGALRSEPGLTSHVPRRPIRVWLNLDGLLMCHSTSMRLTPAASAIDVTHAASNRLIAIVLLLCAPTIRQVNGYNGGGNVSFGLSEVWMLTLRSLTLAEMIQGFGFLADVNYRGVSVTLIS